MTSPVINTTNFCYYHTKPLLQLKKHYWRWNRSQHFFINSLWPGDATRYCLLMLWLVTYLAPSHLLNQCCLILWLLMIPLWISYCITINSLSPGRFGCDFKNTIFYLALLISIFRSPCDNTLRWMPCDFTGDKSKLVQVMAWWRQATSHYLSQCWPRSILSYGVTRP